MPRQAARPTPPSRTPCAIASAEADRDAAEATLRAEIEALRAEVDAMERLCGEDYWPVPGYNQMLFYV